VLVTFGAPCDGGLTTETCRDDTVTNIYLLTLCVFVGLS
jgi:hypothetical protein